MREAGGVYEKATRRRRSSSRTNTTPQSNAGQQGRTEEELGSKAGREGHKKRRKRRDRKAGRIVRLCKKSKYLGAGGIAKQIVDWVLQQT